MKLFVIEKGHLYKELSKDSYNKNKLMEKKGMIINLLDTLKKHSQFQKCGILKLQKFKINIFENSKF